MIKVMNIAVLPKMTLDLFIAILRVEDGGGGWRRRMDEVKL